MSDTLVVNLFGGPGVSKSTNAALVFGKLKLRGVNVEIASEFAKDLVWEGRSKALDFQPYVIGKQMWRVHRLLGEVDVVITDSPILFGLMYGEDNHDGWEEWVVDTFREWYTQNFHLIRNFDHHPYNPKGRTQSREEAEALDKRIEILLDECQVCHHVIEVGPAEDTAERILQYVLTRL